jgi:hypothetical protein
MKADKFGSICDRAEVTNVPRLRFQQRGGKWVGSYRDTEINSKGEWIRRTVTVDASVASARAARSALQPYLDRVNVNLPPPPPKAVFKDPDGISSRSPAREGKHSAI